MHLAQRNVYGILNSMFWGVDLPMLCNISCLATCMVYGFIIYKQYDG